MTDLQLYLAEFTINDVLSKIEYNSVPNVIELHSSINGLIPSKPKYGFIVTLSASNIGIITSSSPSKIETSPKKA